MLINYSPTITGGFVFHVMRDRQPETSVREKLDRLGLSEEEEHDLVKAILIAGFRDLEIDVDKKVKQKLSKVRQG